MSTTKQQTPKSSDSKMNEELEFDFNHAVEWTERFPYGYYENEDDYDIE